MSSPECLRVLASSCAACVSAGLQQLSTGPVRPQQAVGLRASGRHEAESASSRRHTPQQAASASAGSGIPGRAHFRPLCLAPGLGLLWACEPQGFPCTGRCQVRCTSPSLRELSAWSKQAMPPSEEFVCRVLSSRVYEPKSTRSSADSFSFCALSQPQRSPSRDRSPERIFRAPSPERKVRSCCLPIHRDLAAMASYALLAEPMQAASCPASPLNSEPLTTPQPRAHLQGSLP